MLDALMLAFYHYYIQEGRVVLSAEKEKATTDFWKIAPACDSLPFVMRSLMTLCGGDAGDASDGDLVVMAYIGYAAYTRGESLRLSDIAPLKELVTSLSPRTENGRTTVALMDGYYVRRRDSDEPIAWVPTIEEADAIVDDYGDPDVISDHMTILKSKHRHTRLSIDHFAPLRDQYYNQTSCKAPAGALS